MIRRNRPSENDDPQDEPVLRGFDDFELSLGDIMRGERATLGKSLLDVQRELKIKATYISAIENADPTAFETPGFVAGYVRSYARYLGLDPEWAYAAFRREARFETVHGLSAAASTVRKKPPLPDERDPFVHPAAPFAPAGPSILSRIEPGVLGSVAVLMGLVVAIGWGGWAVLQEVQKVQFVPVDQAPGVVAELDPVAPAAEALGTEESSGVNMASSRAFDRLYRAEVLDAPVMTPRDGPIATLDPTETGPLANPAPGPMRVASAEPGPAATPEPAAAPVKVVAEVPEVVVFAVRPSWVRVRAADGTVLLEKILEAGEQYVLPASDSPPELRTGNAGSVYFAVNGETYGPAGAGPSVVKGVELSPDTLVASYAPADPGQDSDLAIFVAAAEAVGGIGVDQ